TERGSLAAVHRKPTTDNRQLMRTFIDEEILERFRLHGMTFLRDGVIVAVAYTLAMAVRFDGPIPADDYNRFLAVLPFVVLIHLLFVWLFGIHRRIWKYAGIRDVRAVIDASILAALVASALDLITSAPRP